MRSFCFVALLLLGASSATNVHFKASGNPVEEVITLLEDLQTQCQDEGKEESKTYDEFACFCKDTTDEKSTAILDDKTDIETHKGTLVEKTTLKADLQQQIKDLNKAIDDLNKEMSDAQSARDAAKTKYESMAADMAKAVQSIEGAVDIVTKASSGGASFLQVKGQVKERIHQSLIYAKMQHSFEPKVQRVLHAFLQDDGDEEDAVPESDFESHTGDLEEIMHGLEDKYVEKEEVNEDDEKRAVEEHNAYMEAKTASKQSTEEELDKTTEKLNQCMEDIGTAEKDLTEASAKLADDETYLKDLTAKCELKAREWDQRSSMRAGELEALEKALGIIKDTVLEKDKANEETRGSFVQAVEDHSAVEAPKKQEADQDADSDADEDADFSFLELAPHKRVKSLLRKAVQDLGGKKRVVHAHKAHLSAHAQHELVKTKVIDLLKAKA